MLAVCPARKVVVWPPKIHLDLTEHNSERLLEIVAMRRCPSRTEAPCKYRRPSRCEAYSGRLGRRRRAECLERANDS